MTPVTAMWLGLAVMLVSGTVGIIRRRKAHIAK